MFRTLLGKLFDRNPVAAPVVHEAALQERIACLEAAIAHAPIAIAVYDKDDILRVHNAQYEAVHARVWSSLQPGFKYADLMRASLLDQGFKGDLESEIAQRVQTQRNGDGNVVERRYADGAWRRISKVRTPEGFVAGFALDVTELRQREDQLVASKAELTRVATDSVPSAMAGFAKAAEEVISATGEVKELIGETSQRAVATGAAAEELAATINHIATTMKDMADSAVDSSREAAAMNERMERLGEALAKVDAFSDMIRGVAAQTSLLALNATIEAARAGEAGRGFAVVAAEVKALSKQTGDATAEIAAQVSEVEALMADARAVTAKIATSLMRITDKAADVASAVEQQRDAAQSVSSHMADIISRAGDTSEAAERATQEGAGLASSARALEVTVRDALLKVA